MSAALTKSIKRVGRAILPESAYDAASFQRHGFGRRAESPGVLADRRYAASHGLVVTGGPFEGLKYSPALLGRTTAIGAKMIGSYEQELHPTLEQVLSSPLHLVIDIGCAEGYYAVGIARSRPDVKVIAFDIDPQARHMCRLTASLNDVDVEVKGEADPALLTKLRAGTLVFSDCEGAELQLLDPTRIAALRDVMLLVETHDFIQPGTTATLIDRFSATHNITEIETQPRRPQDFALLEDIGEKHAEDLLSEGRPAAMKWLYLEPSGT